jgi:sec-independent protein translocase protein TatB
MFDIGGPEFLVIAVIALVVIGPERLPKVMGQVGRGYRQLRNMSDELLREARTQWAEGMKEVEEVSADIQGAWNNATSDETPALPPPPAYQVPLTYEQPSTAASAGPWVLAAFHRETSNDVELLGATFPEAPTALPRRLPAVYDPMLDDAGVGGPSLMGPAPTEEELAAMAYDLPEEPDVMAAEPVQTLIEPAGVAEDAAAPPSTQTETYAYEPATVTTNGSYAPESEADLPLEPAPRVLNGASHGEAVHDGLPTQGWVADEESVEAIRERTIIELYRQGGISLDQATEFLGVGRDEFLAWVELAGNMRPRTDAAPLA